MKIFFAASHRGKQYFDRQYKNIYQLLSHLGFIHLNKDIIDIESRKFYDRLEGEGISGYTKKYDELLNQLKQAEIIVFECSIPSFTIGFLIDKALENNIPVIALYYKQHIPHFLAGIEDEKFQIIQYDDDNMKKLIKDATQKARSLMDKRFNFFINPQLLGYLNKVSREQRISKSTFIRNLIKEHMVKNQ